MAPLAVQDVQSGKEKEHTACVWHDRIREINRGSNKRSLRTQMDIDCGFMMVQDIEEVKFYLHSGSNIDPIIQAVNIITSLVYSLSKQQHFQNSL